MLSNYQILVRFLKEYKVYTKYVKNMEGNKDKIQSFECEQSSFTPSNMLFNSFTWSETKEGYYYWRHIYYMVKKTQIETERLIEKDTTQIQEDLDSALQKEDTAQKNVEKSNEQYPIRPVHIAIIICFSVLLILFLVEFGYFIYLVFFN